MNTELRLGFWKDAKFYLKSKASFIDITSIAWLREYRTFSDSSVVSLKSSPWSKYTQLGTIFRKKIVFHHQTFFLLEVCSLLDCS